MTADELQALIEDATFDYTMGDIDTALAKIDRATAADSDSLAAWHASAEIRFNARRFDEALAAAEQARRLAPDDLFINTTLSRIWMEKGNKAEAEKYGAKAKMLGWKEQLKTPPGATDGLTD